MTVHEQHAPVAGRTASGRKYLFVRVLEACNADCFMCGFALSRDRFRMSPESFADVLAQSVQMGVGFVRFTGGEPLMHREIETLIGIAASTGVRSSLITNGHTLAVRAAGLASAGLDQIIVSLDSGDPEQHDHYRNTPGLFGRAVSGIRAARAEGITVRVNSVVGPHNYAGMPGLKAELEELGVAQWELSALKLSAALRYQDVPAVRRVAQDIYDAGGLRPMGKRWFGDTEEECRAYFEDGIPPRASGPVCVAARDVMYLDPKAGFLYPCSLLPHRSDPTLYGGDVRVDGRIELSAPSFRERQTFFVTNGPGLCTGCSSSAAGYSDRSLSDGELEDWAY